MDDLYHHALNLASAPASKWPSLALLTADAFLCILIIWKIPCSTPPFPPSPFSLNLHLLFSSTKSTKERKKSIREANVFFIIFIGSRFKQILK